MDFRLRDRKVAIRVQPVSSVLYGKAFGSIDHNHAGSAMSAGVSTSINVIIIVIVMLHYIL